MREAWPATASLSTACGMGSPISKGMQSVTVVYASQLWAKSTTTTVSHSARERALSADVPVRAGITERKTDYRIIKWLPQSYFLFSWIKLSILTVPYNKQIQQSHPSRGRHGNSRQEESACWRASTTTSVIITIENMFHSPADVPRAVATGSPIYAPLDVDSMVGFLNQVHPISRGFLKLNPACSLSHCLSTQRARSQVSWLMWKVWGRWDNAPSSFVLRLNVAGKVFLMNGNVNSCSTERGFVPNKMWRTRETRNVSGLAGLSALRL